MVRLKDRVNAGMALRLGCGFRYQYSREEWVEIVMCMHAQMSISKKLRKDTNTHTPISDTQQPMYF